MRRRVGGGDVEREVEPGTGREASYQPHKTEGAWLQALIDVVAPAMDPGCVGGIAYYMGARGPEHIRSKTLIGTGLTLKESVQMLTHAIAAATPEELRQVALASPKPGIHSLVEVAGTVPALRWPRCPIPLADSLALTVSAPRDQVAILSTISPMRRALAAPCAHSREQRSQRSRAQGCETVQQEAGLDYDPVA